MRLRGAIDGIANGHRGLSALHLHMDAEDAWHPTSCEPLKGAFFHHLEVVMPCQRPRPSHLRTCDLAGTQAELAHEGRAVELQARAVAVHETAVLVPHHGLRVLRCHQPQPLAPSGKAVQSKRLAVASQLEHIGHRIDRVQRSVTSLKARGAMSISLKRICRTRLTLKRLALADPEPLQHPHGLLAQGLLDQKQSLVHLASPCFTRHLAN